MLRYKHLIIITVITSIYYYGYGLLIVLYCLFLKECSSSSQWSPPFRLYLYIFWYPRPKADHLKKFKHCSPTLYNKIILHFWSPFSMFSFPGKLNDHINRLYFWCEFECDSCKDVISNGKMETINLYTSRLGKCMVLVNYICQKI